MKNENKNTTKRKWKYNTIDINITDDGGQAIDEELRHVQMSRWGKHTGEGSGREKQ